MVALQTRIFCAFTGNIKPERLAAFSSGNSNGSQSIGVIMKTVNLKEKFALFSDYYKRVSLAR